MTTPSNYGPTLDVVVGATNEYGADCYDADAVSELVVEATDVFRFKVWSTDGSAPEIDADSVALLTDTFTTVFGTGVFTSTSDHGLIVGDAIYVSNSGGALPAGLSEETAYWLITQPADDTFTVSATKGGSAVTLTDNGTGTHTWTQQKSHITVDTVGVAATTPAHVTIVLDQVDTASLVADTDYNYRLYLVDDSDGNKLKPIIWGIMPAIGSATGDNNIT